MIHQELFMNSQKRPLAVITGASTGIGYELANVAAERNFDLIISADEPGIETAAEQLGPGCRSSCAGRSRAARFASAIRS